MGEPNSDWSKKQFIICVESYNVLVTWLINVEHVGDFVPRVRVVGHGTTVVGDAAWAILLKQTDHARAPGLLGGQCHGRRYITQRHEHLHRR